MDPSEKRSSRNKSSRRRQARPLSLGHAIYDYVAIAFMLASPVAGATIYGGVRLSIFGPLLISSYIGILMVLFRPLLFEAGPVKIQVPPIGGLIWLFLGYAIFMAPRGIVPSEARLEFLKIASYFGSYLAWTELASRYKRWRWLLSILILLVSMLCLYALIQHSRGSNLVLWEPRPEGYGMRASGTYICPNHFAHIIGMLFPYCLALIFARKIISVPVRLFSGYAILLFIPVIIMTLSRSGWLGFLSGGAITILCFSLRKNFKAVLTGFLLLGVVLGSVFFVAYKVSPVLQKRVHETLNKPNMRLLLWKDTRGIIEETPVFGHGAGSYRYKYAEYQSAYGAQQTTRYAHNEFLHTWAEYGAIGLVLVLLFLMVIGVRTLWLIPRVSREKDAFMLCAFAGAMAASVVHCMFDFNYHLYANAHLLVMLAGITFGGLFMMGDSLKTRILSKGAYAVMVGGITLMYLLFGVWVVRATVSNHYLQVGQDELEEFNYDYAEECLDKAIALDKLAWRPILEKAKLKTTSSFWNADEELALEQAAEAEILFNQTLEKNPYELEALFGLAKLFQQAGDAERAVEFFKRIEAVAPCRVVFLAPYALYLKQQGRLKESLAKFEQLRKRSPSDEMVRLNIKMLKKKIKKKAPRKKKSRAKRLVQP